MRLLVCHPGASYSTADLHSGLMAALADAGVELHEYDLETRLDLAHIWTRYVWKRQGKPDPKPQPADIIYWASKDIIERALRWDVDGVLIVSAMFLHPDLLILLKRAQLRTAVVLTESPYDDEKQARILPLIDFAWTNERSSLPYLRQFNPKVKYLPHAYNPAIHHPDSSDDPADVPAHDVVLVSSMFAERYELMKAVDWTGIDLGLYGDWRGMPSRSHLRKYIAGGITKNEYAAALYRKAKIGLNLYRESKGWGRDAPRITHAESLNPRAVELAACGCYQISQYRAEIGEVFGDSVGTFTTPAELEVAIRQALAYPNARKQSAWQACKAVQGRTFTANAEQILRDLVKAGWPAAELEQVAA